MAVYISYGIWTNLSVSDNCDIRELDPKWYRQHIGFVSQEPVLFACSIAENISYGVADATQEQVTQI